MSAFDEIIGALKELEPTTFAASVAKHSVTPLRDALSSTLSAGTTPDGTPWAPRKKDGGRAYANAASKLDVAAHEDLLRATVTGPKAFGHRGSSGVVRQMLPDGGAGLPNLVADAMMRGAEKAFDDATRK